MQQKCYYTYFSIGGLTKTAHHHLTFFEILALFSVSVVKVGQAYKFDILKKKTQEESTHNSRKKLKEKTQGFDKNLQREERH